MIYRISTFFVYYFFKFFFRMRIKGRNVFPDRKPFILASNHLSNLDPPVLAASCPYRVGFLAKDELFRCKFFALYFNAVGVVPLKRDKNPIKGLRSCLKILKHRALLVFPQGTRGASFDESKDGVGFLQKKTNLPVIAAKIQGTDDVFPKGAKFFHKGQIRVRFAKVEGINSSDSYQEVTSKVIEKIKNL